MKLVPSQFARLWPLPFCLLLGMSGAWFINAVGVRLGMPLAVLSVGLLCMVPTLGFIAMRMFHRRHTARPIFKRLEWWHWLWMLVWASGFVLRERAANDIRNTPTDAAATYRIVLMALVAFVLLLRLSLRRSPWLQSLLRGLVGALALYALICGLSTIWSVYPALTAYKSLEYLTDVALLAAVLTEVHSAAEYKALFDWTWVLYGLLLSSVWIGLALVPHLAWAQGFYTGALGHRLVGVFPEQDYNRVGDLGAILGLVALVRLLGRGKHAVHRWWYVGLFLFSAAALVLSQTRSAMGGFIFGCLLLIVLSRRIRWAYGVLVTATLITLGGAGGAIWSFLARGQQEHQIASLSGRVQWWSAAWHVFLQHPFTGLGAYAGGRFAVLAAMGNGFTSTLHSDYLETLVGNGLFGPLPVIVALAGTWWVLLRCVRSLAPLSLQRQLALEAVAVLSVLTVRSIFMTILVLHPPLHFLVVLGYAEFLRRHARAAASERLEELPLSTTEWAHVVETQ